ncbi:conserved hypothetical protein [Pseudoalteromonas sp. 3J6]|uniref:hypothetical protein n=1 Tax=Pseudoalteromonas sp. 3J6 TaxID=649161 RepID=UPI0017746753|nr:hypothetical protein [Pseudoalteromonas sp. 3J6]CAD2223673.1 conserved hypothetical protein [Pseudoalteromonas sp. 3J6]|tara:strand:- start:713 stop:1015 length:303 start_codon:yes stop_codon:yes gene_type:complete
MRPTNRRNRPTSSRNLQFIHQVIAQLKAEPEKLQLIKNNLAYYREQTHLKRGFLLAIERFDWVFEATDNIDEICEQIMADDYIGNRLRRYPLLFKGVVET